MLHMDPGFQGRDADCDFSDCMNAFPLALGTANPCDTITPVFQPAACRHKRRRSGPRARISQRPDTCAVFMTPDCCIQHRQTDESWKDGACDDGVKLAIGGAGASTRPNSGIQGGSVGINHIDCQRYCYLG